MSVNYGYLTLTQKQSSARFDYKPYLLILLEFDLSITYDHLPNLFHTKSVFQITSCKFYVVKFLSKPDLDIIKTLIIFITWKPQKTQVFLC